MSKEFVNGFESWHETHFDISGAIIAEYNKDEPVKLVKDRYYSQGRGGIYELAQELTDEFELLNKDNDWSAEDYFDAIETFLKEKFNT